MKTPCKPNLVTAALVCSVAFTNATAAVIEEQVRRRMLRWFSRHGLLDPEDGRDMLAWA